MLSPIKLVWGAPHLLLVWRPYNLRGNQYPYKMTVLTNCAQGQHNAHPLWILHGRLHFWNMMLDFTTVKQLCGQNPCIIKAEQKRSQYVIHGLWISLTRQMMFSSHNSFQYSMNLDISLMISSSFFIGSGLQGFESLCRSKHFSSLSWRHTSMPFSGS